MATAIILAAGSGRRFGGDCPKQYSKVHGFPLVYWTILPFTKVKAIETIILVVGADDFKYLDFLAEFERPIEVIEGGSTRQESSRRAIDHLRISGKDDNEVVLIHDGARPLVSQEIIEANIELASEAGTALTAIKPSDSIYYEGRSIQRDQVWLAQTPQSFRLGVIGKVNWKKFATDDYSLVGGPLNIVDGSRDNIKVTTVEDLGVVELLLARRLGPNK